MALCAALMCLGSWQANTTTDMHHSLAFAVIEILGDSLNLTNAGAAGFKGSNSSY